MPKSIQNNTAYDLSLFEPDRSVIASGERPSEEKKKHNLIRLDTSQSEKSQRRKRNPIRMIGIFLLTVVVASVSSLIVYNNVVIFELNEKIISAKKEIENQDNLKAQYQLKIDSRLTNEIVREYAENKLGMTQAKSAQKEFVALADGDQGKVLREDGDESIFGKIGRLLNFS